MLGAGSRGAKPRVLSGERIEVETRGHGASERFIRPILMENEGAGSLLVVEVLTPAGHWSSYPPHKHDHDDRCRGSRYWRRSTTTGSSRSEGSA